ncbi:hypothetical protein WCE39_06820 [Luteimonas sp. MJ174]|uniref:hypothetical protein n=1 Tax=Luteimonas sp. MJ174 TaxID=3129237 RepID=UPI0031BAE6C2
MDVTVWLACNGHHLKGSLYEEMFVQNVLTRVRELDFRALSAQYRFMDDDGRTRYCDFVIQEGEGVRIAIEVDGYDKRGTGHGMSRSDFLDWQRRQASLVAQGWRVIRFANVDVRDNALRCAELLGLLLRDERSKESHSRSLEQRIRELETAQQLKVAEERASYGEERKELELLKAELVQARQTRKLSQEESRRLEELEQAQLQVKMLERETNIMKTTIWAFTLLLVVVLVLVFQGRVPSNDQAAAGRDVSQLQGAQVAADLDAAAARAQPAPSLAGSSCEQPLPWGMARDHVGKVVAIAGPVVRVGIRDDVRGRPVFITMGQAFPSRQRVDLVIWQDTRSEFLPLLEQGLEGRDVCAFAEVGQREGIPQLVLRDRSELKLR